MENIILGLLLLQSRTIYQLRKRIDEGLAMAYSCSMGSIQAALKNLLASGCICASAEGDGRHKKVYSITDEGKQRFYAWVNGEFAVSGVKIPELTKVYFLGFADKDNRAVQIEHHAEQLRKFADEMDTICREGEAMLAEMPNSDVLYFQLQTAKYGRDFARFNAEWYDGLLAEMRGK